MIGGISWVSSVEYYRTINQLVNERLGGVNAAKIILYSVNYQDIKTLTEAGDWLSISHLVCDAARKLENAGADCIMVGANTMHKIAGEIQAAVNIPFIHIATATAQAIKAKGIDSVILLGTKYVMQQDFYKSKLSEQGITTIIPGEEDIEFINHAIYEEFGKNIFLPATKQRFLDIISELSAQGAKGVIFGCTEIPLLLTPQDVDIPSFDTTLIHSTALANFALS